MMRPAFLTGDSIYLRPLLAADAEQATAWFPSPFPINATRAGAWLQAEHTHRWHDFNFHYAIASAATDAVVGGAAMRTHDQATGWLTLHMAPCLANADALQAETLTVVIPWLRDECEMMVVTVPIAADRPATLAAAARLGMLLGVRLRQHQARPSGSVDLLLYQALGAVWRTVDA